MAGGKDLLWRRRKRSELRTDPKMTLNPSSRMGRCRSSSDRDRVALCSRRHSYSHIKIYSVSHMLLSLTNIAETFAVCRMKLRLSAVPGEECSGPAGSDTRQRID